MLQNYVKNKEPQRQELSKLIKAFLARGNKIQLIEASKDPIPYRKVYANEPF